MKWQNWPSLLLNNREDLPGASGIYIIADSEDAVWYVGKSTNLRNRWHGKGHHRYRQLNRTNRKRQYRIYWSLFPPDQLEH